MGKYSEKVNPLASLMPKKEEPEHKHEHVHKPVQTQRVKEIKSHRLQVLMKPSTMAELDEYVNSYGVSRAEIIQGLIEEYLENPDLRLKIESKLFDR